jgi:dihydroneopterin aldolase
VVDRIILKGIRVTARHGVSDEERARAQEFVIDVTCSTDARAAARTDDLAATVDYVRLRDVVVAAATGSPVRLIETLADRIAQAVLDELHPAWTRVRVTKLRPGRLEVPASVEVDRGAEPLDPRVDR